MKSFLFLPGTLFLFATTSFSQSLSLELTFTASNAEHYVQLDSIRIINQIRGSDTVLYWPDTTLLLHLPEGVGELHQVDEKFKVLQNFPNPFKDQTSVYVFVPEADKINIMVTDEFGTRISSAQFFLNRGFHSFRFSPGRGKMFFFTAQWKDRIKTIKLIPFTTTANQLISIQYTGMIDDIVPLKYGSRIKDFPLTIGEELIFIGYHNNQRSALLENAEVSMTFKFQFAYNVPCPDIPEITYEGQVYTTVQLYNQCWFRENLNLGTMIPGSEDMANNEIVEKFCYADNPVNCSKYGGLYQWDEAMQYSTTEKVQGICPPGWHVPSDEEWKIAEGSVDSIYGYSDAKWDIMSWRGYDVALRMKSTSGWNNNGNGINSSGFTVLPSGIRNENYLFSGLGENSIFLTSTEINSEENMRRRFSGGEVRIGRNPGLKNRGRSLRCLKDE